MYIVMAGAEKRHCIGAGIGIFCRLVRDTLPETEKRWTLGLSYLARDILNRGYKVQFFSSKWVNFPW